MNVIDSEELELGCLKIIDALGEYSVAMKIAILHELIKTIPVNYELVELKK